MNTTVLLAGTEKGIYFVSHDAPTVARPANPVALQGIEVDPLVRDARDPMILYAAAGKDGLWRSADGGQSWSKIWEQPSDSVLYTITAHSRKAGVIYAGLEPAALWKSEDGGKSWRELEALQAVPDKTEWRFFAPRHAHVRALTIRAGESDTLYVGIEEGGIYISEDGGRTFHSRNDGLYRDIHQIHTFPGSPSLLFGTTGDGLYRSEDTGLHWMHVTKGLTRSYTVPFWIAPDPPHTMFVGAAKAPPPSWYRGERGADAKLFRSHDRGLTWEEVTAGWPDPQSGMIYCLVAHPADPTCLFAGTTDGKVFISADQGSTWEQIVEGLPEVYSLLPVE